MTVTLAGNAGDRPLCTRWQAVKAQATQVIVRPAGSTLQLASRQGSDPGTPSRAASACVFSAACLRRMWRFMLLASVVSYGHHLHVRSRLFRGMACTRHTHALYNVTTHKRMG